MGMPSRRTNNFPESGRGLGHVTPTIFGSTVGYPSDSLASCLSFLITYLDHAASCTTSLSWSTPEFLGWTKSLPPPALSFTRTKQFQCQANNYHRARVLAPLFGVSCRWHFFVLSSTIGNKQWLHNCTKKIIKNSNHSYLHNVLHIKLVKLLSIWKSGSGRICHSKSGSGRIGKNKSGTALIAIKNRQETFCIAALHEWNQLSTDLRKQQSTSLFKRRLKSYHTVRMFVPFRPT